jgi:hypothetical protein
MAKNAYALLIYQTVPAGEEVPERDQEVALAGHRELQAQASARGELHAVARLADARGAKTVKARASAHEVTDGPFIETKEWLVGFYLVDCADEAEALARARLICPVGGFAIEVRPVAWRWRS